MSLLSPSPSGHPLAGRHQRVRSGTSQGGASSAHRRPRQRNHHGKRRRRRRSSTPVPWKECFVDYVNPLGLADSLSTRIQYDVLRRNTYYNIDYRLPKLIGGYSLNVNYLKWVSSPRSTAESRATSSRRAVSTSSPKVPASLPLARRSHGAAHVSGQRSVARLQPHLARHGSGDGPGRGARDRHALQPQVAVSSPSPAACCASAGPRSSPRSSRSCDSTPATVPSSPRAGSSRAAASSRHFPPLTQSLSGLLGDVRNCRVDAALAAALPLSPPIRATPGLALHLTSYGGFVRNFGRRGTRYFDRFFLCNAR